MKIQEKFIKFLIFVLILIISLQTKVMAKELKITIKTDKDEYKIGEIIEATVDWKENMQATSFKIEYDSDKLEFISANINESFYNSNNVGEISINWASLDEMDLTQMKFQFKALKKGKADVRIKEELSFADGNLVSPTSYDISTEGMKTITIEYEDTEKKEDKEENKESYIEQENQEQQKEQENRENFETRENKEDNTLAKKTMPQTGIKGDILLIIILTGIVAGIFSLKNKNYSDI